MTTPRKELVDEVAEELITYLGSGTLNETALTRSLSYEGLDISDFEELKKLHFALAEDVSTYVQNLPEWIRRLRTENRNRRELSRGEIRGAIDWKQTKEQRHKTGFDDPTLFVTSIPDQQYDIPENRLVKKLITHIINSVDELTGVDEDWQTRWNGHQIEQLREILERNVYLEDLPDPEDIQLTERELNQIARARREIYVKGQSLYQKYLDLMENRFERPGVSELLKETLVEPTKDYKLFELFCLFGIIRRLKMQFPELSLKSTHSNTEAIAVLEDSTQRLNVYYNQGGPLQFFEKYPTSEELQKEGAREIFIRQSKSLEYTKERLSTFLDRGSNQNFFAGRPDIIVLRYEKTDSSEVLRNVTIGEVKHTDSESTFASGLRELHEYLIFVQSEEFGYLLDTDWTPQISIRGLICTDGVSTDQTSVGEIEHLDTIDLKDNSV